MKSLSLVIVWILCIQYYYPIKGDEFGGLYPRESMNREVKTLDGIWDFRLAPLYDPDLGFTEKWYEKPLKLTGDVIRMPVPSSYNDVTENKDLRDHVGWAWYDREFYVPNRWVEDSQIINIRFGSAHYYSILYINGIEVLSHEFGHLPFGADITDLVTPGVLNLVTLCINNTLNPLTIPQGRVTYKDDPSMYPEGYFILEYGFDFFNYAGIHRPVYLYTTPKTYIEDISISTDIDGTDGIITYTISVQSPLTISDSDCGVGIYDEENNLVSVSNSCSGQITIQNAKFWWPYLMADDPGYLYTLKANVTDSLGRIDEYPQKFGIRTIGWDSTTVTINNVPLYLRGCGKHEDFNIIGKGVNYANIVKDFSLLKWLGANSFRTSHYPYAEEIMDLADEEGIMVIDECPAVEIQDYGDELLSKHKNIMEAMHRRDKNRPSVIMWSVANEAITEDPAADNYFMEVVNFVKQIDDSRPVTSATNREYYEDNAAQHMDVIMINRYYAWYVDHGHLELIELQTVNNLNQWYDLFQRPLAISEYGAGALTGYHSDTSLSWSEEYQVRLMTENFKAFDSLRNQGFFFGEMIWNFADFATPQDDSRPGGNRKGVLTRERRPKYSAHYLRARYHALANATTDTYEPLCPVNL